MPGVAGQVISNLVNRVKGLDEIHDDVAILDGIVDVPAKDATADVQMSDVVGKKDDTAVAAVGTTKSLVAYVKGVMNDLSNATDGLGALKALIDTLTTNVGTVNTNVGTVDGLLDVPTKDAATDTHVRDVVGKKDDTAVAAVGTTKSLMAYLKGVMNDLSNGTDGLGALKALIDTLTTNVGTVNTNVGTVDTVVDTLTTNSYARQQVKVNSVTAAANAGADTTLATVGTAGVIIEGVVIHADAAQVAHLTSCPVMGGAAKVLTFIAAADALQADLDAENKQVAWTGEMYLPIGATIVMVHNGSGADALNLTVSIKYRAAAAGGTLA